MRFALILIVLVLSGCQELVDSNNKLASFNSQSSNTSQYSQDYDLWSYIANNQEINVASNEEFKIILIG